MGFGDDITTIPVIAAFIASLIVSCLVGALYYVFRIRRRRSRTRLGTGAGGSGHGDSPLDIPRNTTSSIISGRNLQRHERKETRKVDDLMDWGEEVQSVGVDLGSFSVKVHTMKRWQYQMGTKYRSVASLLHDGIHVGEPECAYEHFPQSFFSLTRDMAERPTACVSRGEVECTVAQALGELLTEALGDPLPGPPPLVGCSLPPYFHSITMSLYNAAHAAGLGRFYIFHQHAALMAALIRTRRTAGNTRVKPPQTVVFADCGNSGISAAICTVRSIAGHENASFNRRDGVLRTHDQLVATICQQIGNVDRGEVARVLVDTSHQLRHEFAAVPDYMAHGDHKVTLQLDDDNKMEMDRNTFLEIYQPCLADVEAVANECKEWLTGKREHDDVELVLTGNGFKIREVRDKFEEKIRHRLVSYNKIDISQGLAILAAMQHPRYKEKEQAYDIEPLFALPTVDASGVRPRETGYSQRSGGSFLSPLINRSSSALGRRSRKGGSTLNSNDGPSGRR